MEKANSISELFKGRGFKTFSSLSCVKVGNDSFKFLITLGGDTEEIHCAVFEKDEYSFASELFRHSDCILFHSLLTGKFNIYGYDCGEDIVTELEGSYEAFGTEGYVAFLAME